MYEAVDREMQIGQGDSDPQQPLAGQVDGVSYGFLQVVDQALSRRPEDRPADALEFKRALELSLSPDAANPEKDYPDTVIRDPIPPEPDPEPDPEPEPLPRSGLGKFVGIGVVGLLLLGGGYLGYSSWQVQRDRSEPLAERIDQNAERKRVEEKATQDSLEAEAERKRVAQQAERARLEAEAAAIQKPRPYTVAHPGDLQLDMIRLLGGSFEMGSPPKEPGRDDDEKQHSVTIKRFAIGKYEVTFEQYDVFARATSRSLPDDRSWGRGVRPVINVSWQDAVAYAAWLAERTGRAFRLPTEAEWEYAARAGTSTPFYTGQRITTDQANFSGNGTYNGSAKGVYRGKTVPVGSFAENPFGLFDVHGNVWEWTCSGYEQAYSGAELICEKGQSGRRSMRGGSWVNEPSGVRSAYRTGFITDFRTDVLGFRLAEDAR